MNKYISIIIIALALAACGKKDQQEETTTEHAHHGEHTTYDDPRTAELMAIHDSLMPQMGKLMALRQKLNEKIESLDSLSAAKYNPSVKAETERAQALVTQLETADKSMMEWMHGYKADTLEKLDIAHGDQYVTDQKVKIVAVKSRMVRAVEEAEALLKER